MKESGLDKLKIISGGVTAAQGFKAGAVAAEIRYENRLDLALVYSEVPALAAAVYTKNRVQAAPLLVTREHLADGRAQAIIINSGNANACNGDEGIRDAKKMALITAQALQIAPEDVVVASTGVMGLPMPMHRVEKGISEVVACLSVDGGSAAARAIMTTDLNSKEVAVSFSIGGKKVTIGGMAKGSGMIHPDMATMLAFITTDALIDQKVLQKVLCLSVERSFNMITVDGDTSTNDMVVFLANGMAQNPEITEEGPEFELFKVGLDYVTTYLAQEIARDGEGATRLIEVRIKNAATFEDGKKAARAVAGSSLVKTAVFGQDANWGRIIAALGYSGAEFDPQKVDIWLAEIMVARAGTGVPFDEEKVSKLLGADKVIITVDLHAGNTNTVAWGCDLTFDYVKINASYRN